MDRQTEKETDVLTNCSRRYEGLLPCKCTMRLRFFVHSIFLAMPFIRPSVRLSASNKLVSVRFPNPRLDVDLDVAVFGLDVWCV